MDVDGRTQALRRLAHVEVDFGFYLGHDALVRRVQSPRRMKASRNEALWARYERDAEFRARVDDFVAADGMKLPEPADIGKFPGLEDELELAWHLRRSMVDRTHTLRGTVSAPLRRRPRRGGRHEHDGQDGSTNGERS